MSDETLPPGWAQIEIEDCLLPYLNGKRIRQGWSPQCEDHPAQSHDEWAVLRTSAIQDGSFVEAENKKLPDSLEPRPHLEVKSDDILITCAGPRSRCGVTCLVRSTRPRLLISGKMYQLRADPDLIERQFLELFLRESSTRKKIDVMKTGISDSGLNLTHDRFKTLTIPLPPLNEQKRIVAKIEELFIELEAGKESLRVARRQLGVYRQSLLKQAFEGRLTATWRTQNPAKLNSPATQTDNEALPATWNVTTVGKVGRIETGTTPPTADPKNYGGDLPFFKPTDLEQARYVKTAREHLSQAGQEHARVLPSGSVLVTCIDATIGKTGLAQLACATNQQINSISPAEGISSEFVYFQTIGPAFQEQIKTNASSTTLPILNKSKFSTLPFVFCSLPEQQEIVRLLDEQFEMIERNEQQIDDALRKSEALRQAILKKAFTGRLVPQVATDEPATELLARLRTEREVTAAPAQRTKRAAAPANRSDWFPEIPDTQKKSRKSRHARRPGTTDLQAGIVALAIVRFGRRNQFLGHTNAEKVVHLADYLADLQLDRQPVKDAAGPNDFKRAKEIEHRARAKGWFTVTQDGPVYHYHAGDNLPSLLEATQRTLGPKLAVIENLLEQMRGLDTKVIEIFATVYAAWNNLLLSRMPMSDEAIVTEARENWHPRKLEIDRNRFFRAIAWMKKHDFVPQGRGLPVPRPPAK